MCTAPCPAPWLPWSRSRFDALLRGRKKKAVHKTTSTDDKRLQSTLKRLGVNTIPGIEEVNLFQEDGKVVHFTSPKGEPTHHADAGCACQMFLASDEGCAAAVQASIAANTFVISGASQLRSETPT